MAIWVEIHCDTPLDKASLYCAVYLASYPSALGRSMIHAHDTAVAKALKSGWTKQEGLWFCPVCSKRN